MTASRRPNQMRVQILRSVGLRPVDLSSPEREGDVFVRVVRQAIPADQQVLKGAPTDQLRAMVGKRAQPVEHHSGAKQSQLELCSAREDQDSAVRLSSASELVVQTEEVAVVVRQQDPTPRRCEGKLTLVVELRHAFIEG